MWFTEERILVEPLCKKVFTEWGKGKGTIFLFYADCSVSMTDLLASGVYIKLMNVGSVFLVHI